MDGLQVSGFVCPECGGVFPDPNYVRRDRFVCDDCWSKPVSDDTKPEDEDDDDGD